MNISKDKDHLNLANFYLFIKINSTTNEFTIFKNFVCSINHYETYKCLSQEFLQSPQPEHCP